MGKVWLNTRKEPVSRDGRRCPENTPQRCHHRQGYPCDNAQRPWRTAEEETAAVTSKMCIQTPLLGYGLPDKLDWSLVPDPVPFPGPSGGSAPALGLQLVRQLVPSRSKEMCARMMFSLGCTCLRWTARDSNSESPGQRRKTWL